MVPSWLVWFLMYGYRKKEIIKKTVKGKWIVVIFGAWIVEGQRMATFLRIQAMNHSFTCVTHEVKIS